MRHLTVQSHGCPTSASFVTELVGGCGDCPRAASTLDITASRRLVTLSFSNSSSCFLASLRSRRAVFRDIRSFVCIRRLRSPLPRPVSLSRRQNAWRLQLRSSFEILDSTRATRRECRRSARLPSRIAIDVLVVNCIRFEESGRYRPRFSTVLLFQDRSAAARRWSCRS